MAFPGFDLSAFEAARGEDRRAIARSLDDILSKTGFLVLRGHGVSDALVQAIWSATDTFFAQSPQDKARVAPPRPGAPYGWLGPNAEALAASKGEITPPDLKESFNGGPRAAPAGMTDPAAQASVYQPTPWPEVPDFRPAWQAYYDAMEDLANRVMVAFAAALDLPDDHFASVIDAPISALRALQYPATVGQPLDRQQRAGAHTDYGSLTILRPQSGSRGLEVMSGGDWVEVPAEPGAFVVNIGDLMARWTADRWVSTLHRVVAKPDQPARRSLAFFHQPNWDAEIVPLDGSDAYPPVLSGPYLMEKFRATGR